MLILLILASLTHLLSDVTKATPGPSFYMMIFLVRITITFLLTKEKEQGYGYQGTYHLWSSSHSSTRTSLEPAHTGARREPTPAGVCRDPAPWASLWSLLRHTRWRAANCRWLRDPAHLRR